jgi:SAM-dependent methyltransferase
VEASLDIANVEQAAAWDGHEGDQWTEHADRYDRASHLIWDRFLEADPIGPDDRVLDIGCGTGHPTRDAARRAVNGSVTGVDLSSQMLELARERSRAEGLTNVDFVRADAQVHPFVAESFDLAFSSFGAMFFGDPVAAYSNVARGVRPGGRLALLAWRELDRNDWLMQLRGALASGRELPVPPPDAPSPFSLADPERVRGILGAAGYRAIDFAPIDEQIDLGADTADAYAFVETMGIVEGLSQGLDDEQRAQAMSNIRQMLDAHATPDGVLFGSSAWLITAKLP